MKTFIRVISLGIFFLVFGETRILMANDDCGNITFLFTPVREEFVDELPENIRYLPTKSMLPIVYRGAAKNWGAMQWTPESLNEMGFPGGGRNIYQLQVYKRKGGERKLSQGSQRSSEGQIQKFSDLLERDTMFKEDYLYGLESSIPKIQTFLYLLFNGLEGAKQFGWDIHEATLLAQFFGERLVLLIPPDEVEQYENLVDCVDKALNQYMNEGRTIKDAVMKMVDNEELEELAKQEVYSPLQRAILRPGDILYIPAEWGHRVFYLKDSAGVAQQIMHARNPK